MKKILKIAGVAALSVGLLTGCGNKSEDKIIGKWEYKSGAQRVFEKDKTFNIDQDNGKTSSEYKYKIEELKDDKFDVVTDIGDGEEMIEEFRHSKDWNTIYFIPDENEPLEAAHALERVK